MRWTYEFKVGLFSIAAIVAILYMFFVLSPDLFQSGKETPYYTVVDDASGIVNKTQVKISGVIAGKVKKVELQASQSRIEFSIRSDIKIPAGSEVMIKEKGLLGDVFIEILRAEDKGEYMKPGDYINPSKDQVSISKFIAIANSIGKDVKKMTGALSDIIGGEEGSHKISKIFQDAGDITSSLKGILSENRAALKNSVGNIEQLTNSLNTVVTGQRSDLQTFIENIRDISGELRMVLRPENRERFDRLLTSLEQSSTNIKNISQKIDSGQGTLGRLVSDDKTLNEIEGAVKDLRTLIAPANKIQLTVDFHGEALNNQRTQAFFNLIIQPRPDKYYLLGLTDVFENEKEVTHEDLQPDKINDDAINTTKYRRTEVERRSLRFNVQYAQRWAAAQLRFGLFETTGGIAGDFFLLDDQVRFTVEAFDWRKSSIRNIARLKTYVNILFFNHIYAMIGLDELTRKSRSSGKQQPPYVFIGFGFKFTDEDLKSLFGLAAKTI